MGKQLLFLDFDGPLFPDKRILLFQNSPTPRGLERLHPRTFHYIDMCPYAVRFLNEAFKDVDYELVISSSWRFLWTKEEIKALFEYNGLNLQLQEGDDWKTKEFDNESRRDEIAEYVDRVKPTRYLVLDDAKSGPDLVKDKLEGKLDYNSIILVNTAEGLNYVQILQLMMEIRGQWRKKPKG